MLAYFQIGNCTTQIVMFGDSLVAGYGVLPEESLPSKLEKFLKDKGQDIAIINFGVSGNTTTDGLARLDKVTSLKPNYVIIVLGGNDMLRGYNPKITYDNLEKIILKFKEEKIKIILTKVQAATNYGPFYKGKFDQVYDELEDKYSIDTIPFFMEYVINDPTAMQGDGIHPNSKGIDIIVSKIGPMILKIID